LTNPLKWFAIASAYLAIASGKLSSMTPSGIHFGVP
jgi:hypothetical protein